jgi:NTE family protein
MSSTAQTDAPIGLVLAGGGARGAYEAGALSVLLPRLEERGERVEVIVGTSVGALNGTWLAANAHREARSIAADARDVWLGIGWDDVLAPLVGPNLLGVAGRYLGGFARRGVRVESVLDSAPLRATLERLVDTSRLAANVRSARLRAAGVVATSASTGRSVVFHAGGGRVRPDASRGIEYCGCALTHDHIRASASIPGAFRATSITSPATASGWYVDGGTRLNTPIKPALKLGARRVVVIGLNTTAPARRPVEDRCPDVFEALGHLTQAVLADPLSHDVRTLATINRISAAHGDADHRVVPYMLIAPSERDRLGAIAQEVFAARYSRGRRMSSSVGVLGGLLRAGDARANGELLSYLFFDRDFADALIAEGAADARRWMTDHHRDIWERWPVEKERPEGGGSARPSRASSTRG